MPVTGLEGRLDLELVTLERASSAEQVAATIRAELLTGEVAPGTRLRDQAIAAALGVSRNTAREALMILVAEGLLTRYLHRGVEVTELSLEELNDVYQARLAVELGSMQFMAAAPGDSALRLREAIALMDEAAAADNTQALLDADRVFHQVIVDASGSRRVSRFNGLIQTEIRLTRAWHGARMPAPTFVARHREIVEAIEARRFDLGGDLLRCLIEDGQERLRRQLTEPHEG